MLGAALHPDDFAVGQGKSIDLHVIAEAHIEIFGHLCQFGREHLAIAGFVVWQA